MELMTDRDIPAVPAAHRVTLFVPDRPVDGGTVFKRPPADESTRYDPVAVDGGVGTIHAATNLPQSSATGAPGVEEDSTATTREDWG